MPTRSRHRRLFPAPFDLGGAKGIVSIDKFCQHRKNTVMPTQNVSLSPLLKKFVESHVRSGQYANSSEVVRAGLRLLAQDEALRAEKIKLLRQAAKSGIEDMAAGRFTDLSPDKIENHVTKMTRLSK